MARGNVELIRHGLEVFARRDLEAWRACFDPEVDVREDPSIPDAGGYKGHEGLMQWLAIMERNWDEFHVEGLEYFESGDDVIALMRVQGRGRRSGADVDGRFGSIFTVRDGRVVEWRIFAGWDGALRAAGLDSTGEASVSQPDAS
jgi:ketosteroid isomerase-like protein